jgi:hypothetical protein
MNINSPLILAILAFDLAAAANIPTRRTDTKGLKFANLSSP